ncbi:MAG: type III secretion system chaperone [Desulfovibrionaceae bacterium]|nr:type III secretion system chaperone [Desulfovibrionaceae bacterium]
MDYSSLVRELGGVLGFELTFSDKGTCGVFFDNDEVLFEVGDGRMFIMADLGSSEGREDAYARLLTAGNLGLETGFSCIGIDEQRGQFTLCRVLEGDLAYPDFEKLLTVFVSAVRYWKKWLSLPPEQPASADDSYLRFTQNSINV